MKNPLLTTIALLVLAGVLFAQSFPSGGGAHPIIRKIELVGPIQVEGIVPLRNHISIPFDLPTPGDEFLWLCPVGTHARVTLIAGSGHQYYLEVPGSAPVEFTALEYPILNPGDTLRIVSFISSPQPGILQLAVEYD